jgi:hypothetical protein
MTRLSLTDIIAQQQNKLLFSSIQILGPGGVYIERAKTLLQFSIYFLVLPSNARNIFLI